MGGGKIVDFPLDSAKRELQEEAGLSAEKWTCIAKAHTSNSITDEVAFIYLAENLSECANNFDETEDLLVKNLHFSELYEMAMTGQISDALSLCAIFKTALLRPELLQKN
jgi:8-oxo-dGTP pyrophosphatase MutT (NUDIX family)